MTLDLNFPILRQSSKPSCFLTLTFFSSLNLLIILLIHRYLFLSTHLERQVICQSSHTIFFPLFNRKLNACWVPSTVLDPRDPAIEKLVIIFILIELTIQSWDGWKTVRYIWWKWSRGCCGEDRKGNSPSLRISRKASCCQQGGPMSTRIQRQKKEWRFLGMKEVQDE